MSFFKTFDKEHTEEVEVSIEWGYGLEGENGRRIKGNEYSGVEMRNENGEPYTAYEDEEGNHLFWWDEANRDAEINNGVEFKDPDQLEHAPNNSKRNIRVYITSRYL